MNKSSKIELFNIFLMVFSLGLSILLPFHVFLFSYAILGPLHYLTEISWLHDKNYFIEKKSKIVPIFFIVCFFTFCVLADFLTDNIPFLLILSLVSSLYWSYIIINKNIKNLWFHFIFYIFILIIIFNINFLYLLFYFWITTFIHVYLFTGLFMWSGNIKRHNFIGHLGFILFILIPIFCFIFPINHFFIINDYIKNTFFHINFSFISENLNQLNLNISHYDFFDNEWVQKFSRFMSFAYTYHYLNWFSKTKIIGWNNISKSRLFTIIILWIFSIIIYVYDYWLGYQCLMLLSLLHVFLEFPLNFISIHSIWKYLTSKKL